MTIKILLNITIIYIFINIIFTLILNKYRIKIKIPHKKELKNSYYKLKDNMVSKYEYGYISKNYYFLDCLFPIKFSILKYKPYCKKSFYILDSELKKINNLKDYWEDRYEEYKKENLEINQKKVRINNLNTNKFVCKCGKIATYLSDDEFYCYDCYYDTHSGVCSCNFIPIHTICNFDSLIENIDYKYVTLEDYINSVVENSTSTFKEKSMIYYLDSNGNPYNCCEDSYSEEGFDID